MGWFIPPDTLQDRGTGREFQANSGVQADALKQEVVASETKRMQPVFDDVIRGLDKYLEGMSRCLYNTCAFGVEVRVPIHVKFQPTPLHFNVYHFWKWPSLQNTMNIQRIYLRHPSTNSRLKKEEKRDFQIPPCPNTRCYQINNPSIQIRGAAWQNL